MCGVWLQVNKPYLPLAAGDMTPSMANAVVWGTAVAALAIGVASGSAPLLVTLAMRCAVHHFLTQNPHLSTRTERGRMKRSSESAFIARVRHTAGNETRALQPHVAVGAGG